MLLLLVPAPPEEGVWASSFDFCTGFTITSWFRHMIIAIPGIYFKPRFLPVQAPFGGCGVLELHSDQGRRHPVLDVVPGGVSVGPEEQSSLGHRNDRGLRYNTARAITVRVIQLYSE